MAAHYARNAYLQAKVQPETNPKRLILMLYEGALEDLRLAKEGIEQQNARKRGEHLSRAVAIISTLLTSLDSNVTDEPITFLRGLYQAMLVELSKVAVTHDVNTLDLAFRYLERLKQIWEQDVMGLQRLRRSRGRRGPASGRECGSPSCSSAALCVWPRFPAGSTAYSFCVKPTSREGEVMHGLYEALLSACDHYQAMQQAHLHCLATEAQPDIERLVFEREHLFADLQNHLTAVVYQGQKAGPEPALVPIFQARLTALLEEDAILNAWCELLKCRH